MTVKNSSGENSINIGKLMQWVVPTIVLFVYVLVTLYSFSADMKSDSRYNVRQKVADYNDSLVTSFDAKIDIAKAVANATADVVAYEISNGADFETVANNMLKSTVRDAGCTGAYVVDRSGSGYSDTGESITLDGSDAFDKSVTEKKTVISEPVEEGENWNLYIYAPALGDQDSLKAVLVYVFPADNFESIPTTTKYDGKTSYMVISKEGDIVSTAGRGVVSAGGNIFDGEQVVMEDRTASRLKNNIDNRNAGTADCSINGEPRLMVYDPCANAGLSVATLVTESYINNEVYSAYSPIESILIRVLVAMIAFFVVILVVNLANRAVNTRHNQTLQEKAETDLLTGLLNKMSTEQRVSDYLVEASAKGESAILYLIDIDNFKKVNDTMGHAFGDELLAGLGVGLSTLYRATDIVGRIGGDEFLVVMKNVPNDEDTKRREAEKLLDFFRNFKVGEYVQYKCTASIGGAVFSQDGADFDELYKAADNAMYESKRHGKNRIAYYGEELEGPVIDIERH